MSSFLGAAAPGAAIVVLARNVSVSLATTAAQVLCTPTQSFVPTQVVVRAGATAWSATGSFALGITAALSSFVSTKVVTSLPTTGAYRLDIGTSGSTSAMAPLAQAAGTAVYFNMVQVEPTATASTVDLLGYLI